MINSKYLEDIKNINTFISSDSIISPSAQILMNSIILGKSIIKDDAIIGPNSIIIDSVINNVLNTNY